MAWAPPRLFLSPSVAEVPGWALRPFLFSGGFLAPFLNQLSRRKLLGERINFHPHLHFQVTEGGVDRIIRHLKLTFAAEKPPPAYVFGEVALMAALMEAMRTARLPLRPLLMETCHRHHECGRG